MTGPARRRSHLSDAFSADHVLVSVDGRRFPLSLAVRVPEAAVALGRARRAVPAVDADVRRTIAEVVAQTAVTVGRARLTEAHRVRQALPRVPAAPHSTYVQQMSSASSLSGRFHGFWDYF